MDPWIPACSMCSSAGCHSSCLSTVARTLGLVFRKNLGFHCNSDPIGARCRDVGAPHEVHGAHQWTQEGCILAQEDLGLDPVQLPIQEPVIQLRQRLFWLLLVFGVINIVMEIPREFGHRRLEGGMTLHLWFLDQ